MIEIFQLPFIYSLILFFLKRKLNEAAFSCRLAVDEVAFSCIFAVCEVAFS